MERILEEEQPKKNKYQFAILVDSGCDVPNEYLEKYPIYVIPLRLNYDKESLRDRVDISPEEVYERLNTEIPTTSLPLYDDLKQLFDQIVADGYKNIFCATISSGLSGTHNMIRLVGEEYESQGVVTHMYDTKNIAIASGFYAMAAADHLSNGMSFQDTITCMRKEFGNSNVYFCVETLEYLRKGGRIGRVASMLGSVIGIKPIINCAQDGAYVIAGKERGTKKCVQKAEMLAKEFAAKGNRARIAIMCSGESKIPLEEIKHKMEELVPNSIAKIYGQISPVLGVHVGPGLIGIAVYIYQ